MIHATTRAVERLRWPASTPSPKYSAGVGGIACGATVAFGTGLEVFRAEDARALLNNRTVSTIIRKFETPAERRLDREWRMPTCTRCLVLIDQALENPFTIHAAKSAVGKYTQQSAKTPACGATPASELGVPLFDHFDMNQARRAQATRSMWSQASALWLPSCLRCRELVESVLYGDFAKAFKLPR